MKQTKPLKKEEPDYIVLYAEKLKEDSSLFSQQKVLIESQLHSSSSLFKSAFSGSNFRKLARKYLREIGLFS